MVSCGAKQQTELNLHKLLNMEVNGLIYDAHACSVCILSDILLYRNATQLYTAPTTC